MDILKKYWKVGVILLILLFCTFAATSQQISGVNKHQTGVTYNVDDLVSLDGVIYKAVNQNSTTPPDANWEAIVSGGDVTAATNLADNAITRGDGGGKGIQDSGVNIDDLDNVSGVTEMSSDQVQYVTGLGDPVETEGLTYWNNEDNTLNVVTGLGSTVIQIGQETLVKIHNATGVTLSDGKVIVSDGTGTSGVPNVVLGITDTHLGFNQNLAMITGDVLNGQDGFATVFGKVRGLNTSSLSVGPVYLSSTAAGELTNSPPQFPNYIAPVGFVSVSDISDGIVIVNPSGNSDNTIINFWNGTFRETFKFLVTSDGATITGSLSPMNGHPDLTMIFSDGFNMLDTSPDATIILTAGTDEIPQLNYVYIPVSTKVLTVSTSGFPTTEHIKVAYIFVASAVSVQVDGPLINQNINDNIQTTSTDQGHLSHITRRLRLEGTHHISGTEGSSVVNNTPTPDSVSLAVTGGIVTQLHNHVFQAFDTSVSGHAHVVNHSTTAYKEIADLHDLVTDGEVLSNTSFSIVMWGVINSSGEPSKLMINLPSNSYSFASPEDAASDAFNYSNYNIPAEFKTVGFLIARVTYTYKNNDWVVYETEDLRGKVPNASAGGGGAGGAGATTFLALTDAPSSYAGSEEYLLKVNAGSTAVEFISPNISTLGITGTKAQYDTSLTDGDFLYVGDLDGNFVPYTGATGSVDLGFNDLTADAITITPPSAFNNGQLNLVWSTDFISAGSGQVTLQASDNNRVNFSTILLSNVKSFSFDYSNLTGDGIHRNLIVPNESGTLALLSDIGGGSGDVTKVGTPVNQQIGVWTGDGTLGGFSKFLYNDATETLSIGTSDVDAGSINLWGDSASGGGALNLWNGALGDTDDSHYNIRASAGGFEIKGAQTGVVFRYDSADSDLEIFGTTLINVLETTPTALDLSSTAGNLVSMATANTATTYTFTGAVPNGYAQIRINAASEPTVTSATKTNGADFIVSTDMYMVVWHNGTTTQYYFLEI